MTTATRDVKELEAEILRAHEAGDKATLERLQAEYRSSGHPVERISSAPIRLRWGSGAQRSRSTMPTATSTPKVRGGSGVTVVVRPEVDRLIREIADEELEICGGLYGRRVGDELILEQAIEVRDQVRLRDTVILDLDQLQTYADHFAATGMKLCGDWHTHPRSGSASSQDRIAWCASAGARGHTWIGLIAEPRSTWTGPDWGKPNYRAYIARPGNTDVAVANVVVEVAA